MTDPADMAGTWLPGGETRLAGVIGWPVAHSRSPRLHGTWLRRYGIDGTYVPLAVPPERIEAAVRGLQALGFRGANVTIPHKQAALALADHSTSVAERIGAANTLTVRSDGTIEADNTDGYGFLRHLTEAVPDWDATARPTIVLGAGGAARAVIVALLDAGTPEIRILNRTRDRAEALVAGFGDRLRVGALCDLEAEAAEAGLLVNTTSLGMAGQPPLAMDCDALPAEAVVYDLVYNPLETGLLRSARVRGLRVVDGLGMLLHQAVPGFERWFGQRPQVDRALRETVAGDLLSAG